MTSILMVDNTLIVLLGTLPYVEILAVDANIPENKLQRGNTKFGPFA